MKRLVIFIAFLFALFSCRQNTQHSVPDITITVKVDDGINLKDEKPIKAKRGVLWKELKSIADSKIETKKEYVFSEWRVKEKEGKVLIDDVVFSQDETVYAISKKIERKVKIHIKGDERVTILGDDFIDVDILLPKTFKDVETKIKAKLNLKPEWSNGDYDIFDWKLNNENGQLILQNTPIKEDITVFARTNYTKFDIEGSTIKGYKGEKPRGRIIIPKEITKVGGDSWSPFYDCRELISVDLSLCRELTRLDLSNTGITSIDVSKNTELKSVSFKNCSALTAIDLSTCAKLTEFYSDCFSGAINAVVTLPSSIKEIGKKAFGDKDDNYCKKVIVPNNEIKQLVLDSGYPEAGIEVK